MDSGPIFPPPNSLSNKYLRHQALTLLGLSLIWCLFILSAQNYHLEPWYPWLLWSRVGLAAISAGLAIAITFLGVNAKNLDTTFLLLSLSIQSTHGALEGATSVDFYNYCGIIFPLMSICYRGTFANWLRNYFAPSLVFLTFPVFFKDQLLRETVGSAVDHFSQLVVGLFIGVLIARINTSKHMAYKKLVQTQEMLISKERKLLTEVLERKAIISEEVARLRVEISRSARNAAIGELATQIAHDIRSPLAALSVTAAHLEPSTDANRFIIQSAVQRLSEIAEDLLLTSRDGSGSSSNELVINGHTTDSKIQPTLIAKLTTETLAEIQCRLADSPNLKLTSKFELGVENASINVNPSEFKRAVSNLVNNGVESLDGAGQVTIELSTREDGVRLEIRDTGKGISAEHLNRIGKRGVSIGKPMGNGLGLNYAMTKMNSWKGQLLIDSVLGRGTSVTLCFPVWCNSSSGN